jgi:hypothetical protein
MNAMFECVCVCVQSIEWCVRLNIRIIIIGIVCLVCFLPIRCSSFLALGGSRARQQFPFRGAGSDPPFVSLYQKIFFDTFSKFGKLLLLKLFTPYSRLHIDSKMVLADSVTVARRLTSNVENDLVQEDMVGE